MHPYSSKAFQWYQKNDNGHYGLKDINVTINKCIYLFYKFKNYSFKKKLKNNLSLIDKQCDMCGWNICVVILNEF